MIIGVKIVIGIMMAIVDTLGNTDEIGIMTVLVSMIQEVIAGHVQDLRSAQGIMIVTGTSNPLKYLHLP